MASQIPDKTLNKKKEPARKRVEHRHKTRDDLNLLYDRVRLGIVSALVIEDQMTFSALAEALDVTDGNLSTHAKKLESAGYISISKRFLERKPRTEFRATAKGRRSLERYLQHMESIIEATRKNSVP